MFLKNKNKIVQLFLYIFVLSTFNFLTVVSNLFCNLAVVIFSYGLFRDYFLHKKGFGNNLIYFSSVLIHNSAIFPLAILLVYKWNRKNSLKNILFKIFVVILAIPVIIKILSLFHIPIIQELCGLYDSYFINNSDFKGMHTFSVIVLYLLKMLPFFACFFCYKEKDEIDNVAFIFTFAIINLFFQTTFAIRFIPIVVLLGMNLISKFFLSSKSKNLVFILFVMMLILVGLFFYYQIVKLDLNSIKIGYDILLKNIITIWN